MKFISLALVLAIVSLACSKDNNNDNVTNQDSYFMQKASYSNYAEVNAGSLAGIRGNSDSIKSFGLMMVTDHSKAQSSLDSLGVTFNVNLPTTPDSAHLAMAAKLQTLSGYQFDTTYIGAQIVDHMATIAIFQQELATGNNQQVKNYANKNLPVIQMHLQMAQTIQALIK